MANIESKVETLIAPKIEELGHELYDVEYTKEGKDLFLRIFIDNEKGIDLNDCEKVNNGIVELLDEADYIKEQYFLEVSSPGVERVLRKDKHLQANLGNRVNVKLFHKDLKDRKEYEGILQNFNEKEITIDEEKFDRKNIAQIKTVYNWD